MCSPTNIKLILPSASAVGIERLIYIHIKVAKNFLSNLHPFAPPIITVTNADAPKNVEHAVRCCSKAMVIAWRRGRARGRMLRPCDGVGAEAVEVVEVRCNSQRSPQAY